MEKKNAWEQYTDAQLAEMNAFAERYKAFLDGGKTERECVTEIIEIAEKAGYTKLDDAVKEGRKLSCGDKVYSAWMNKSIVLFRIGKEPIENGINILGAHIDSPRMDVKQDPLYESDGFAYLDTHYYGGIKKYQWVALPLAIHGVICKKDGTTVTVNVGENENDPVFFVSDLLIHLAGDQMQKKASEVIEGEALDIIIGNKPLKGEDKDKVKTGVMNILKETYGIEEEDFLSAELEIVPAGKSRDAGFDRSMILGYGHDDRVCAFPSLEAMLDVTESDRTAACILVDKEEIGSVGATGMRSHFFENALAELMALAGETNPLALRRCLAKSDMLSSDVSAGYDPSYAYAFEKKNVAYLGNGIVFNKFTGSRGKGGSNDANAEYMAHIRGIMDSENVVFQTAELGKVDVGGGGTIAYILALYGMNVIDCGVAVLNMHAPWEAISKADLYEAKRGYMAFLKKACL